MWLRHWKQACVIAACALCATECVNAQSRSRVAPLTPTAASPFSPQRDDAPRPPLACDGFCLVTLKLERRWQRGDGESELRFRGRRYQFADRRKRAIFAAAPQEYIPLLNGDCPVSLSEDAQRTPGKLALGAMYRDRLIFLTTTERLRKFNASPQTYFEQAIAVELRDAQRPQQDNRIADDASQSSNDPALRLPLGLSGYCPVTLLTTGRWVRGAPGQRVEFAGLAFLFAQSDERFAFETEPRRYLSAAGGFCPVAIKERLEYEAGHADYVVEDRGRLIAFASAAAKQEFLRNPDHYRDVSAISDDARAPTNVPSRQAAAPE